jgi:hypothetical protein
VQEGRVLAFSGNARNRFIAAIAGLIASVVLSTSSLRAAGAPAPGPTEMTFTEHSPLTAPDVLSVRLHLADDVDATPYPIKQEHFLVYIPKTAAKEPMGLIVLAIYKPADELPKSIFAQLDAANMALIVPKEYLDPWFQRAAACVDAAFNMQRRFTIDPRRIYLFGGADWPDRSGAQTEVAPRVGLGYADVFTGMFVRYIQNYLPITAPEGVYMPHLRPPLAQLLKAKAHPLVLSNDQPQQQLYLGSFTADGFSHTKIVPITPEQYHYPNFSTDWLPEVLKFMDAATANLVVAAGGPATQASDEPIH